MVRAWLGRHRRRVLSGAAATAIVAVLGTLAVTSTGYRTQNTELDDAAVWVVNGQDAAIGRANLEVLELNSAFPVESSELDVVQQGDTVVVVDRARSAVSVVDVATATRDEDVPLPPGTETVGLAGERLVIVADGDVWFVPLDGLGDFDASTEPTLTLGAGSVSALSPAGRLVVYSPSLGEVSSLDAATEDEVAETTAVDAFAGEDIAITAVGGSTVLLDVASGVVDVDGSRRTIDGAAGAVLQQPSDGGRTVAIGTATGLVEVPLDGGETREVGEATGRPVAPVAVGDCLYAAWDDGTLLERCVGDDVRTATLEGLREGAAPQFRENRGRVLLNDGRTGRSWAVQDGDVLIDNWGDLLDDEDDRQDVEQNDEDAPPEYETTPSPPVAVDDEFGGRPGRTSPLPVLLNDYDPNGDVLIVDEVESLPDDVGRIDIVSDGQALQVTLADDATGSFSFGYTVSDGRGGSASANVELTVRAPDENTAPAQMRAPKTLVAAGSRATTNVLTTWFDPDGDPFYLVSAAASAPELALSKPDGTVVFTSSGETTGRSDVSLVVSDGAAEGAGRLSVTVRERDDVPIISEPFPAVAHVGQEITVSPLAHARGGVRAIRLAGVAERENARIVPDYDAGTFRFTGETAGVYYVDFSLTDGTSTTAGVARIQVTTPPAVGEAPIPAPHTVFVRAGTPTSVDVLETDEDPAGGVLLVTDVQTDDVAESLRVEVLDQRSVRVVLTGPLDAPVSFPYTISNGYAAATGTITVIEIPEPERPQPPIATADSVSVRVGDVVDIPVLDNDEHPDGSQLALAAELPRGLPADAGLVFVSGDVVRYLAPTTPGDFTITYRVSGPDGQWADADVAISVREIDRASNTPPAPRTVTARVFAGETVRVEVPLSGIDPDGDSVQLVGQSSSPESGNVVTSGPTWFDYEAGAYAAGTDSFEYTVVDALGAQSTAVVRIGVATRADAARNPVAVEDLVVTRPNRTVTVPVLENDSDPDGGSLRIVSVEPADPGIAATITGDAVDVELPDVEGQFGFVYTIANERGGSSSNFITVVTDADAPPAVPVARDSVLTVEDVLDRETVTVDVRANVSYLDGPVSDLEVGVPERFGDVATVDERGAVVVEVGDSSRVVPFSVSNPDEEGVEGWAFVRVPGLEEALPQLRSDADAVTVRSGETVRIDLSDHVVAIGGRDVRLTDRAAVRAAHGNGDDLVVDDDTLEFTSADEYFGPASILFEVTDGESADDPDGRIATLVLPITVTPRDNQPPVFTGATLDVEPGETRTLDLAKLTTYPYPESIEELGYTVAAPLPEGIAAEIDGRSLDLTIASSAPVGSSGSVSIAVADSENAGTAGRIDVRVVPSTLPLASPAADGVPVSRGSTTTVDVLANDSATNPFPDTPLRVVAVRGMDGAGLPSGISISPSEDNRVLTVEVDDDAAIADVSLQYQVADATGDPSRFVWGGVRISVRDRPEPVTALSLRAVTDRSLTLGWTPGAFNNAPIESFTVTLTSVATGEVVSTTPCSSSVCAVGTPGNGRDNAVRVQVTATNAVGTSDPTALGTPAWSDLIPPAPTSLASTPLDSGLRVSWAKPADASGASPIVAYDVTVGSVTQTVTVGRDDPVGTRYVQSIRSETIPNGTPVAFAVQSRNDFTGAAPQWNRVSGSNTPAGAPTVSGSPSADADRSAGTQVTVSWAGLFSGNGAAVQRYYVALSSDGSLPSCRVDGVDQGAPQLRLADPDGEFVDAGVATSHTFTGLTPNVDYRAVVFAYNGQGCTGSPEVSATPLQRPGTPETTGWGALAPFSKGLYSYSVNDLRYASGGGALSTTVSYRATGNGVATEGVLDSSRMIVPRDRQYGYVLDVQFQVCEEFGAGRLCSDWSAPDATPGPVVSTRVTPQLDGLTMTFSDGHPIGGVPSTALEFSCDNFVAEAIPLDQVGSCENTPVTRGNIWVRVAVPGQPVYANQWKAAP
ncbi:fibronectin type III domain-containing protein [Labedella phragmitis]|uniref:Fibronectin type III domain-containing protein n=1 Tax=Labedella phragmitis TaxID=2498849 RepID=A0A444PS11_9MICO|nr:tandem-95 repeat protein [Labedella phragmitis]RWZ50016.1 fibronectin type III domain-containing protein [Labedella phragmitis]